MRKFGTYTHYKGYDFELVLMRDESFHLVHRGNICPIPGFTLKFLNTYVLEISKEEILNSFFVSTKAVYRGGDFDVDSLENGKYRLTTSDDSLYKKLNLHMVDRGWYDIEVPREEIEKMWEERKPSGYGFPFPEGMKEVEEIEF